MRSDRTSREASSSHSNRCRKVREALRFNDRYCAPRHVPYSHSGRSGRVLRPSDFFTFIRLQQISEILYIHSIFIPSGKFLHSNECFQANNRNLDISA